MVVPWGTAAQIEFLESWIPAHKKACAERKWTKFWGRLYSAWFVAFPETDVVVSGQTPIRKVSVSRQSLRHINLHPGLQRLKDWYSNHSSRADKSGIIVKGKGENLLKRKRMLSSAQQYMKMFKEEMEAAFEERWEVHRKSYPEEEQYRHIASYRNVVAKDLYNAAPLEIRNRVDAERKKGRTKAASSDEESSEEEDADAENDEAKAVLQAEKKAKQDHEQALEYQQ